MRELPELATLQQLHQPKQWMETSWWRGELAVLPLEVVFRLSQGRHRKEVVVVLKCLLREESNHLRSQSFHPLSPDKNDKKSS